MRYLNQLEQFVFSLWRVMWWVFMLAFMLPWEKFIFVCALSLSMLHFQRNYESTGRKGCSSQKKSTLHTIGYFYGNFVPKFQNFKNVIGHSHYLVPDSVKRSKNCFDEVFKTLLVNIYFYHFYSNIFTKTDSNS